MKPAMAINVVIDEHRSKYLETKKEAALSVVNRDPDSSLLDRQFRYRTLARDIVNEEFDVGLRKMIQSQLKAGGIAVISGLPTPRDGASSQPGSMTSGEAMAGIVAQATTELLAYQQKDKGRLFQRLFPVIGAVNNGKTPKELQPHLDMAYLPPSAQPEVVHLICVNNDAQASTIFFSMDAVLRGLREGYSERVITLLQHSAYRTSISTAFIHDSEEKDIKTRARPVLYRPSGIGPPTHFLGKAYDMDVQPDLDDHEAYRHALDAFQTVLKQRQADLAIAITAQPGQAISFHQQRLLHGRGPIDEQKFREMVRAWGRFTGSEHLNHFEGTVVNSPLDALLLVDR